jgi:hypothetical protein
MVPISVTTMGDSSGIEHCYVSFGPGHNSQGPYHRPNSLLMFKLEEKT